MSLYWLYGKHACFAALKNNKRKIIKILTTQNFLEKNKKYLKDQKNVEIVKPDIISKKIGDNKVHQNIAVQTDHIHNQNIEDIAEKSSFIVLLDQLSDSHNIGAIIRSSVAFGAEAVINTKDNSSSDFGGIAKSSSGGFEVIPYLEVTNLVNTIKTLKNYGFWCIGLDGKANKEISKINKFEKTALIVGAEDKGLRDLTRKNCDLIVSLPISRNIESLNASVATSIALYELGKK